MLHLIYDLSEIRFLLKIALFFTDTVTQNENQPKDPGRPGYIRTFYLI